MEQCVLGLGLQCRPIPKELIASVTQPNLISGSEIVVVVVDPDTVGDVLALLLDHVHQAHCLEIEA